MGRAKMAKYVPDDPRDFRPHSDGSLPFAAFVLSPQIQHPCVIAAGEIIAIAKATAPAKTGEYVNSFSLNKLKSVPVVTKYGVVPRAGAEVVNTSDHAPAMEFGSGRPSVGDTAGEERTQGGFNKPFRVLGKAGAKIGDFHE